MTKNIRIESAKDLHVYKLGYGVAMEIFHLTKRFPSEEKFALPARFVDRRGRSA
jgi:hypothetical protein